jgi:hypothetical protein
MERKRGITEKREEERKKEILRLWSVVDSQIEVHLRQQSRKLLLAHYQ